jgi:predicted metal-dependent peptidase
VTAPSQHSSRARLALARMPEVDPALAALALWCRHRDGLGRTVTQGETIHYGTELPLMPVPEQIGVAAHHILHVTLRHCARRASLAERLGPRFQADLYDLACDALVNELLLQGGHAVPRPAVRAADLVARLPQDARPRDVLAEWDSERLYFAMVALGLSEEGQHVDDARTRVGTMRAYAQAQGFEPDLVEPELNAGDDNPGAELWAGRMAQALAAGRSAGIGIGAAVTRLADLPRSDTPWEVRLRRLMGRALAQHPRPSHRRPGRAWLARDALARQRDGPQPVFEPGQARDHKRPRLVIGLDTSSSITNDELALFGAEAISLVRRTGAEAHLLAFDTDVHHRGRMEDPAALMRLEMRRDGGTDFDAVLAEAGDMAPSLIVLLTDLDAGCSLRPQVPVIWAVPSAPANTPAFGEVVVLRPPVCFDGASTVGSATA